MPTVENPELSGSRLVHRRMVATTSTVPVVAGTCGTVTVLRFATCVLTAASAGFTAAVVFSRARVTDDNAMQRGEKQPRP